MKNSIEKLFAISSLMLLLGGTLSTNAEENASHKHNKATMPEASHKEYVKKSSEESLDNQGAATPKHTMRNGVKMKGKTHREHVENTKTNSEITEEEAQSSHKHHKATMKGKTHSE